jgi:hypothetical protein
MSTVDPHARKLYDIASRFGATKATTVIRDERDRIIGTEDRPVDPSALIREGTDVIKAWKLSADASTLIQRYDASAYFARQWAAEITRDHEAAGYRDAAKAAETAGYLRDNANAFEQARDVLLDGGIVPSSWLHWVH